MHVGSSQRCLTIVAMTGAPTPQFLGRDLGSAWFPKPISEVQSLDGLLRGLGLADGEREEEAKAQLGESPGDHAFAATSGSRRRFHKPLGVRFESARRDSRGVAQE